MDDKKQFWFEVKRALCWLACIVGFVLVGAATYGILCLLITGGATGTFLGCLAACVLAGFVTGLCRCGIGGYMVYSLVGAIIATVIFGVKGSVHGWFLNGADTIMAIFLVGVAVALFMFTSSSVVEYILLCFTAEETPADDDSDEK